MLLVIQEILQECVQLARGWFDQRSLVEKVGVGCVLIIIGGAISSLVESAFSFSGDEQVFSTVSGNVNYADGTRLPCSSVAIELKACGANDEGHGNERPMFFLVDKDTGGFSGEKMTLQKNLHKNLQYRVVILSGQGGSLPETVVPAVYSDYATTPLILQFDGSQMNIAIARPELLAETKTAGKTKNRRRGVR